MKQFTWILAVAVAVGLSAGIAAADTLVFEENEQSGSGYYEWEANNWHRVSWEGDGFFVPTTDDSGRLGSGRHCVINGQDAELGGISMGDTAGGGTLTIKAGTFNNGSTNSMEIGRYYPGVLNVEGGTFNCNKDGWQSLMIGSNYNPSGGPNDANGIVNLSGGTLNTLGGRIGNDKGEGFFNLSGGVFNCDGQLTLGISVNYAEMIISGSADVDITGTNYNDGLLLYNNNATNPLLKIVGSSATVTVEKYLWLGGYTDDDPNTTLAFEADAGGVSTITCGTLNIAPDSILDLSSDGNTSSGTFTLISSTAQVTQADVNNFRFSDATDTDAWSNLTVEQNGTYDVKVDYSAGAGIYTLTVNSGTGDGNYEEDTVVGIVADAPGVGEIFDVWTGDTAGIDDVNESNTTITMPAGDAEITATYVNVYDLTVNSGTGDGTYEASTVVGIVADAPGGGQQFDVWTGDTSGIDDVNEANTTITMPSADAEITATYTSGIPAPWE